MKLIQKLLTLLITLFIFNSKGSEEIINALIEEKSKDEIIPLIKGATIDELNTQNSNGQLPLVEASGERRFSIMEALLKAQADVNLADHWGRTPLQEFLLSYQRPSEVPQLKLLLQYGADVDSIDYKNDVERGAMPPGLGEILDNCAIARRTREFDERALIRTRANIQRRHSIGPCTELERHEGARCYYCWNNCLYYDVCEQCAQRLNEDEEGMHNHDYQ